MRRVISMLYPGVEVTIYIHTVNIETCDQDV